MDFDKKDRREILYFSFLLIFLISLIHVKALGNHLYWSYPWLDMVIHFLGGLWIGVSFLWFYFFSGLFRKSLLKKKSIFWISLSVVFLAAVSWEIFEFIIRGTLKEQGFISDSLSDILLGVLGGLVAYRYFVFNFIKDNL